jgi:hypothetical protein
MLVHSPGQELAARFEHVDCLACNVYFALKLVVFDVLVRAPRQLQVAADLSSPGQLRAMLLDPRQYHTQT